MQTDEYRATPVVSAPATAISTAFTIDVTASLQRWSTTPAENLGWIFLPTAADGVTIYSSDFATVAYHPLLSVTYIPFAPAAPNQPTLVSPADGASGVSLSPVLSVIPTDPNADPMDVSFYGRPSVEARVKTSP